MRVSKEPRAREDASTGAIIIVIDSRNEGSYSRLVSVADPVCSAKAFNSPYSSAANVSALTFRKDSLWASGASPSTSASSIAISRM
jgi:hypothetical protein